MYADAVIGHDVLSTSDSNGVGSSALVLSERGLDGWHAAPTGLAGWHAALRCEPFGWIGGRLDRRAPTPLLPALCCVGPRRCAVSGIEA